MFTPPMAFLWRMLKAITGVGASRFVSSGSRPACCKISAVARANSRPKNRVSWPMTTSGRLPWIGEFLRRNSDFSVRASPWAASRRCSNVKSRAISPRQPEVPKWMGDFTAWESGWPSAGSGQLFQSNAFLLMA